MKRIRIVNPAIQVVGLDHTDPVDTGFVQVETGMCSPVVCYQTKVVALGGTANGFDQGKGYDFDFARMTALADRTIAGLDLDHMMADTVHYLGHAVVLVDRQRIDHIAN